jgi:hypothetical protein
MLEKIHIQDLSLKPAEIRVFQGISPKYLHFGDGVLGKCERS